MFGVFSSVGVFSSGTQSRMRASRRTVPWVRVAAPAGCVPPVSGVSVQRRPRNPSRTWVYHAHIYYDPKRTRAVAERVCAAIDEKFRVEIDGFRDTLVGPHPIANVLVIFKPDQFEHVVPYLMLNRDGLDMVHPLTEDAVEDHSSYAAWR